MHSLFPLVQFLPSMEHHRLRKLAEEFEATRLLEQRRRLFVRLEAQGLVVSRQTFDKSAL